MGHGLSVEELKEMTKLRLQHQQGRSSPTFSGRPASTSGLGNSLAGSLGSSSGGVGVGVGHERVEWRRSGSASAAMMEDYHRAVAEDGPPSGPAPFRCGL